MKQAGDSTPQTPGITYGNPPKPSVPLAPTNPRPSVPMGAHPLPPRPAPPPRTNPANAAQAIAAAMAEAQRRAAAQAAAVQQQLARQAHATGAPLPAGMGDLRRAEAQQTKPTLGLLAGIGNLALSAQQAIAQANGWNVTAQRPAPNPNGQTPYGQRYDQMNTAPVVPAGMGDVHRYEQDTTVHPSARFFQNERLHQADTENYAHWLMSPSLNGLQQNNPPPNWGTGGDGYGSYPSYGYPWYNWDSAPAVPNYYLQMTQWSGWNTNE